VAGDLESQLAVLQQAVDALGRLAAIVESSDDAIIGKTLDGLITSWNPGAERLYGYAANEAIGRSIDLIDPPERSDELLDILARLRRGERIEHFETRRRRKDGADLTVSVSIAPIFDLAGRITGAASIARDITEQARIEAELRASHEQLAAVFRSVHDGLLVQDATGRVQYANDALARLWGFASVEEMLAASRSGGPAPVRLRDTNGAPYPPERMPGRRVLAGETVPEVVMEVIIRATDESHWVSIISTPVFDAEGRGRLVVSLVRDITDQRQREGERAEMLHREQQAREAAEAAVRVKDEFLSMASHELKTPLTSLKGAVQLLARGLAEGDPERRDALIRMLDRQCDRLTRLVDDLLDVSRLALGRVQLRRQRVRLDTLVTEVVASASGGQEVTSGHRFLLGPMADSVVDVDPDRIEQVLLNLLTNAVKFSPRGGAVDIAVERRDGQVVVSVADQGIGIASDRQGQVFEQFYQAHTDGRHHYGGMGIGLYISRELVTRHGGEMWFTSVEGKGSTFCFSLPLAEKATPAGAGQPEGA
jgi:PAS domain S-box-containing protein